MSETGSRTPNFDLSGKTALVTGASRGLGLAIALGLARQGADIIVVSRKQEACEAVAGRLRALGRRVLPYACHVGDWSSLEVLVEASYKEMGRVDILVNNAGIAPLAPSSLETSEALLDKSLAVNFKGAFRLAALLGPRMVADGGGAIVNISSTAAIRPGPGLIHYAASKAALNAATRAMAFEYAPSVRVNAIMPGGFRTDMAAGNEDNIRERLGCALGRLGEPEEIVPAVLYLVCSSYTTGSVLAVDGGLVGT